MIVLNDGKKWQTPEQLDEVLKKNPPREIKVGDLKVKAKPEALQVVRKNEVKP